ncbi:carbohydrate esterase family 16 protein [Peniophora sp. CONT]|nr:carbohydrate esterase family 16 protein [Peniophora sp. CONT]
MIRAALLSIALSTAVLTATVTHDDNDGVHLAISPPCGTFSGNVTNANAGIKLDNIDTIVSFGDSYTDGGAHDGGPLPLPILPVNGTRAGGRITNGYVWIEHLANMTGRRGALLMDYAISGAVVNASLWPDTASGTGTDASFVGEEATFRNQTHNNLHPDTTLYSIFFGINDYSVSQTQGNELPAAAVDLLGLVDVLMAPPYNARQIMVLDDYGRGNRSVEGEAYKKTVFDGLNSRHNAAQKERKALNVAYVDFAPLWDAVFGEEPGYAAFGYSSDGFCFPSAGQLTTVDQECDDPATTFYWLHGHPSKQTHKVMADYVYKAMGKCLEE